MLVGEADRLQTRQQLEQEVRNAFVRRAPADDDQVFGMDRGGVPSCFFQDSLYTIKALANATVAVAPLERLVALFETQPQIFWSFSCDMLTR